MQLIVAIIASLTKKGVRWLRISLAAELKTEMTEELWVKGICEDVGHLLSQVNWEDLDCDRLQLDSEVMILEGDVLCLGAHPGRRGKGNGPIVVLVYMGRLEGRLQDLGMF